MVDAAFLAIYQAVGLCLADAAARVAADAPARVATRVAADAAARTAADAATRAAVPVRADIATRVATDAAAHVAAARVAAYEAADAAKGGVYQTVYAALLGEAPMAQAASAEPGMSLAVLRWARWLLPAADRTRWVAEWRGELATLGTRRGRACFARQALCGMPRLSRTLRRPAPQRPRG
ncbi:MAG TPA: hypothetical protein VLJ59_21160 [Mycobacteriales bacterium]|nr:hypothetical protein [Mycobacteriales bacterium]